MSRLIEAFEQFFDSAGNPLVSGYIDFFQAGSSTVRKTTYADSGETIENPNPVIIAGDGRAPNVFGSGSYRAILKDASGQQIAPQKEIGGNQTLNFGADWMSDRLYSVSDVVRHNGEYWESVSAQNLGNPPSTDSGANWTQAIITAEETISVVNSNRPVVASYDDMDNLGLMPNGTRVTLTDYGIAGDWVVDGSGLTPNTGASQGTIRTWNNAQVNQTLRRIYDGLINIRWFEAVSDNGATDNAPFIQAAIVASEVAISGTGGGIFIPSGNFGHSGIQLTKSGQAIKGESKFSSRLISLGGSTYNIRVGSISPLIPINETTISDIYINWSNMVDDPDNCALEYKNSFGNSLSNVNFECTTERLRTGFGIYYGEGCFTTHTENVNALRVRVHSPTSNVPTTLSFVQLSTAYVEINTAYGISFFQCSFQNRFDNDFGPYRISVVNCGVFMNIGGYAEEDVLTNKLYFLDNINERIVSSGNGLDGFQGGYADYGGTGITGKAMLMDDKFKEWEYRESIWVPTLAWETPGTSTIVGTFTGTYVKNGNLVTCEYTLDNATFVNGTAAGFLIMSGLPFPAVANRAGWGGNQVLAIKWPLDLIGVNVIPGSSTARFVRGDALGTIVSVFDLLSDTGRFIRGNFTYQCAN
jgi:hypothetical protein